MTRFKYSITMAVLLVAAQPLGGFAQSIKLNQYMLHQTLYNQATALMDRNGSLNLLTRKKWTGIEDAPTTFLLDVAFPMTGGQSVAGGYISDDKVAVEQSTNINAFFAKALQLSSSAYLGVSLSAGLSRYSANYSSLGTYDPDFRNDLRETRPNAGFGVIYFTERYFIGLSLPELRITTLGNASLETSDMNRNHYYMSSAYLLGDPDGAELKPALLISYANAEPMVANFSSTIYLKHTLGLGVNYRTNHEASGILSITTPLLRFGYSYQFNALNNSLGTNRMGTHEFSLTLRFSRGSPDHPLW